MNCFSVCKYHEQRRYYTSLVVHQSIELCQTHVDVVRGRREFVTPPHRELPATRLTWIQ